MGIADYAGFLGRRRFVDLVLSQQLRLWVLLSQVAAALQLSTLLISFGPSRLSDAISVLYALSNAPIAIFAQGALYSYTLSRPDFRYWRTSVIASAAGGLSTPLIGGIFLAENAEYSSLSLTFLIVGFSCGAAVVGASAVLATRLACMGRPTLYVTLSLPTNLALACGASLQFGPADVRVGAWYLVAGVIQLAGIGCRSRGMSNIEANFRSSAPPDIAQATALLIGGIVGYGGPTALQLLTARFPTGQATVIGLASRASQALVGLGVNIFLLRKSNWLSSDDSKMLYLAVQVGRGSPLVIIVATVVDRLLGLHGAGVIATVWILLSAMTAPVARALLVRAINKGIVWSTAAGCLLYPLGFIYLYLTPNVTSYFATLAVIQLAAYVIASVALRKKVVGLAVIPAVVFAVLCFIVANIGVS